MANQSTRKEPATRKAVQAAVKAQAKTQPSPTKAGNAQEGGLHKAKLPQRKGGVQKARMAQRLVLKEMPLLKGKAQ